jgi:gamma-glutamyltranspeptidase/glutathione hydrolase
MIELMDMKRLGPPTDSGETLNMMVRIMREVYTEGRKFNDPESHSVPLDVILSKKYAEMRFKLLKMGVPKADSSPETGSNHVTVVDGKGNVATILHTCASIPWTNGLFAKGVTLVASAGHFLRIMPKPGHRSTNYIAPNIIFKDKKPILSSGSPSISLLHNIIQNSINILDFDIPIDESVNRPRFGAGSRSVRGASLIEADFNSQARKIAERKGLRFDVVNPWNWHHGAFEGIYIDPESGTAMACGDPRRCSKAEGV